MHSVYLLQIWSPPAGRGGASRPVADGDVYDFVLNVGW